MLSALVMVKANCVSELTQRQGREFIQSTVVPGVPIIISELGSSSKGEDVATGAGTGISFVVSDVVSVFTVVTVSEIGTMFEPVPRVVLSSVVVAVSVVLPGVTSLIIVSVHALTNRQLVRTISPLRCCLNTRHSLMKYD